jgi:hypothetical protein
LEYETDEQTDTVFECTLIISTSWENKSKKLEYKRIKQRGMRREKNWQPRSGHNQQWNGQTRHDDRSGKRSS